MKNKYIFIDSDDESLLPEGLRPATEQEIEESNQFVIDMEISLAPKMLKAFKREVQKKENRAKKVYFITSDDSTTHHIFFVGAGEPLEPSWLLYKTGKTGGVAYAHYIPLPEGKVFIREAGNE